jgi:hypothetical protein
MRATENAGPVVVTFTLFVEVVSSFDGVALGDNSYKKAGRRDGGGKT